MHCNWGVHNVLQVTKGRSKLVVKLISCICFTIVVTVVEKASAIHPRVVHALLCQLDELYVVVTARTSAANSQVTGVVLHKLFPKELCVDYRYLFV